MAGELVMPLARARPSEFRKLRDTIKADTPGIKNAIVGKLEEFFEGFRDNTFDYDTIYGVACDLSSAEAWSVVKYTDLARILQKANKGARESFLDGLNSDLRKKISRIISLQKPTREGVVENLHLIDIDGKLYHISHKHPKIHLMSHVAPVPDPRMALSHLDAKNNARLELPRRSRKSISNLATSATALSIPVYNNEPIRDKFENNPPPKTSKSSRKTLHK